MHCPKNESGQIREDKRKGKTKVEVNEGMRVMVGSYIHTEKRAEAEEKTLEVLKYINLYDKKDMKAGNLTIADRKRLEIARALATGPKLLLLYEVIAGLRPTEVDKIMRRNNNERKD